MRYLKQTFTSRVEADLAVRILAESGIDAHVSSGDAGGAIPSMQPLLGVRLQVANQDAAKAEVLVGELDLNPPAPQPPLSLRERILTWFGAALFLAFLVLIFTCARRL
jgi:hypothetical protein